MSVPETAAVPCDAPEVIAIDVKTPVTREPAEIASPELL